MSLSLVTFMAIAIRLIMGEGEEGGNEVCRKFEDRDDDISLRNLWRG